MLIGDNAPFCKGAQSGRIFTCILANIEMTPLYVFSRQVEIFKRQKREKTLSYYSDILNGEKKRKERQAAKSSGDLSSTVDGDNSQAFVMDESGLFLC